MHTLPQQLHAQQQAALDTLFAAQHAVFTGFEKLVDLNVQATRATLTDAAERSRAALSIQTPQDAARLGSALAQPKADQALAYGKQVFDIVAGVQSELSKFSEAHLANSRAQVSDAVDAWVRNAPAGSEGAVAALKTTLASATSAYDTLTRAVKQAAQATQSNLSAATQAAQQAAADVVEASSKAASRSRRETAAA